MAAAVKRALVSLLLVAFPGVAYAVEFRYIAFGDSITAGNFPPGVIPYPPRLETLLEDAGRQVAVINEGKGGESTAQGLTRIDSVLAPGDQVLLLMEGTNDISGGSISVETAHFNLEQMAQKATLLGIDTVHMTIIPMKRPAFNEPHPKNGDASDLADLVAGSAQVEGQWLVDLFDIWSAIPDLYQTYYFQDTGEDPVGHPTNLGHERMAADVADVLLAPLPGAVTPTGPTGDVLTATPDYAWGETMNATWYRLRIEDSVGVQIHEAWYRALDSCTASTCSVTPPDPLPDGGEYAWTVLPRNAGGWGPESAVQALTYWDAPPPPANPYSPDGPTFATDPTFVWNQVADARSYRLEVEAVPSGPVHDAWYDAADICSAGVCSTQPALGLTPGDYLWRVTSRNPAGDTPSSPPDTTFEVRSCPAEQDLTVGPGQLSDSQLYEACGEITVLDFEILADGEATFHAGVAVVFRNGFEAAAGGQVVVYVD